MKKNLKFNSDSIAIIYSILMFVVCFTGLLMYVAHRPNSFSFSTVNSHEVITITKPSSRMDISRSSTITPIAYPKEEVIEDVVEPVIVYEEYWDVPLSESLQDHIVMTCADYGIDPAIVIALIKKESTFRHWVVSDGGKSYGLMQIQPKWHKKRMESLGCDNLLDPYQNVTVGIDILAELMSGGNSIEWALMAYNGGGAYANNKVANGVVSNYAKTILSDRTSIPTYKVPAK